jgi:hypothetical protein
MPCYSRPAGKTGVRRGLGVEMAKRIKAKVQKSARVFVHNDLSNAALHFADEIKAKQGNGKPGILIDGMACAVMVAFTFEANVNFMGFELSKAGKLQTWKSARLLMKRSRRSSERSASQSKRISVP